MALSGDGTPSSTMVSTMVLLSPVTAAKQHDSSLMPLEQCIQAARHETSMGGNGGFNVECPWRNVVCGTTVRASSIDQF